MRHVHVFWCWHAHGSQAVRSEWRQALRESKRIVPVLLDSKPLPARLSEYQWIDVRDLMERHESEKKRLGGKAIARAPVQTYHAVEPTHLAGLTLRRELWRILSSTRGTEFKHRSCGNAFNKNELRRSARQRHDHHELARARKGQYFCPFLRRQGHRSRAPAAGESDSQATPAVEETFAT